jgi:hypothetical protein
MKPAPLRAVVLSIVATAYLPLAASGQTQPQDGPSCSTYASCNELGTTALRHGRLDEAIGLFEQQAGLAELADVECQTKIARRSAALAACKLVLTAYNNLAVAYSDKQDYLRARSWALVATGRDEKDPATQFNLRKIERALVGWQWPQTPAGEYIQYAGRGTWESIIVEPSPPGNLHFCFSGLWWGLNDLEQGPPGMGDLTGTVPLHDSQAEYTSREFTGDKCLITMHFSRDKLEVKQTGSDFDCGFGHNVTANGTFQRISSSAECSTQEVIKNL